LRIISASALALTTGTSIGPYEIVALLGAGGMGEVYRARDARLAREVAIKILPAVLAADPDRLRRFELEARAAAGLTHPNIVAVHDVGHQESTWYVVSELLEGQTLRERINVGGLAPRKAVGYARQIAAGLAAAHAKGIVHRDLKPENLFITVDDRVKILDFGLAKLTDPSSSAVTIPGSAPGLVLGTAGYMSPEQASGQAADHRSDIFSFGAVLFEMVAGRRAFSRPTPAQTMAAIIDDDLPETGSSGSPIASRALAIARRCLEKSPNNRFQSTADLGLMLEHELADSGSAAAAIPQRGSRRLIAAGVGGMLLVAAGIAALLSRDPGGPASTATAVAFSINLPPGAQLSGAHPVAISRDGQRIVYTALRDGRQQLFMRTLDHNDAAPIAGSEGAVHPVFSPDGTSIAFFSEGSLKRIPSSGGVSTTLAPAAAPRGLDWGADDRLVFVADADSGLSVVSASGGPVQRLTQVNLDKGETNHRWPVVLPDGSAVLFSNQGRSRTESKIGALSYRTGTITELGIDGVPVQYLNSGHLVYVAINGDTFAAPFDASRLAVTGSAIPLAERPTIASTPGDMGLFLSQGGTMATIPFREQQRSLVVVRPDGTTRPLAAPRRDYYTARVSRDGKRVAAVIQSGVAEWDIWLIDVAGNAPMTRLTVGGFSINPFWEPDHVTLTYSAFEDSTWQLLSKHVDRNENARVLYSGLPREPMVLGWVAPGRSLAYTFGIPRQTAYAVNGSEPPKPITPPPAGPFRRQYFGFSADGRWLAYSSDQSGRFEVHVMSFPDGQTTRQVSSTGGIFPVWSKSSRQLFYQRTTDDNATEMMRVNVNADGSADAPVRLFKGDYVIGGQATYDVFPNGDLLMLQEDPSAANTRLDVVVNWPVLRGLTRD
jgi:Tol biopolymer transport system component